MSTAGMGRIMFKPQCVDIAKGMQLSGTIEIVLVSIIFIMLMFGSVYNNSPAGSSEAEDAAKAQHINRIILMVTFMAFILMGVGIWHIIGTNRVKKCVLPTTSK
ncbi:11K virion structural protein [Crangon crangon nudivirus]|uniref:11K virion structural protein n=1 Tax=Crangon crangon nudivirus TaxID=2880838 RepID=A0AAE8Y0T2_9VIRU|nr:11K virion structural protein [Crangon crangon nudivirus]UBZ25586.1 11K virion structural protein [Crangon crangon nudivirus]